jgi:glycosyltransferase involved in cell wall biosynthesis
MVVNGINGYVTPAGDASMIADRLLRIMTDRELARRMSSNSRNRAQSYDWGNVAKEYLSVYQSLE